MTDGTQPSSPIDALAGALAATATAIMCMPCARRGGFFVPTSDLIQADITGRSDPHPVFRLARRLITHPPGTPRVLVLFDDLDVTRNWILPPDAPTVAAVWPTVRSAVRATLPAELADVALLSEWLRTLGALDTYEAAIEADTERFLDILTNKGIDSQTVAARRLMADQLSRRHRFTPTRGVEAEEAEIRVRAARHLANYAVQGRMVVAGSAAVYLLGGNEEAEKMSVFTPEFGDVATPPPADDRTGHGVAEIGQEGPVELVAAAIPASYAELRGSLPLYLDDLPATPGAVRPGLATDIVTALGKLLTPGTRDTGATEIRALNSVLGGGPANKDRVISILDWLLPALASAGPHEQQPGDNRSLRAIEHRARKLFGHLVARWGDDALVEQHLRHRDAVTHLASALGSDDSVALAVTGSYTTAPGGWWHPFLSDIDVLPLRYDEPSLTQIAGLQDLYDATPRPPWVYVNIGACIGVGGLTRDPRLHLFVAKHLPTLNPDERRLLVNLLDSSLFLAGDRTIYDTFRAGLDQIRANIPEAPPQ